MQGIDATAGGMSFGQGRDARRGASTLILGAVVAAAVGGVAAYALHARHGTSPVVVSARPEASPAPAAEDPTKVYGAMIVEPEWLAETARQPDASPILASLEPQSPAPAPASVLPPEPPASAPTATSPFSDAIPLPPVRDVPYVEDSVPLPPARPPEFAEPTPNHLAAPDRRIAQPAPGPAAAPADDRNIIQKLLGIGQQPGAVVASRPPTPAPMAAPVAAGRRRQPLPKRRRRRRLSQRRAVPEGRSGIAGLFGGFSSGPSLDRLGYDRQTAIYDISARTLYMPDGTRIEAHSGLGSALDDLRYVSARAVGPTPPHLYELTLRESLFHGVQAIRLNPVGEGGLYGRAGLLAHPYMLGPNGELERLRIRQGLRRLPARLPERTDPQAGRRRQNSERRDRPRVRRAR